MDATAIPEDHVALPKIVVSAMLDIVRRSRGWLNAYADLFPEGPPGITGRPDERKRFVSASNELSNSLIGYKDICSLTGGEPRIDA